MIKIGFREARAHFSRFIMSIVAICLGVAFIVGSFSFRNMLQDQMTSVFASSSEGDVYVRGVKKSTDTSSSSSSSSSSSLSAASLAAGTNYNSIPSSLISDIKKVKGVKSAFALMTMTNAALVGKDGTAVGAGTTGITAVSMAKNATWRSVSFIKGTYPHGAGQVSLLKQTADAAGLKVGDKTTFVYASGPKKVKISGIFTLTSVAQGTLYVGIDPQVVKQERVYTVLGSSASAASSSTSSASSTNAKPSSPAPSASAPSLPSGQGGNQRQIQEQRQAQAQAQAQARAHAQAQAKAQAQARAQEQARRKAYQEANAYISVITVYGTGSKGRPLTDSQQKALAKRVNAMLDAKSSNKGKTKAAAITGDALRAEQKDGINSMMGFIQPMILIFAFIALFVGTFIIANTFSMIVRESMRRYALLRSVGASPSQVFTTVIIQALVMGLVGSVLGIFLGWGMMSLISVGLSRSGSPLTGSSRPGLNAIIIGLIVGLAVSLIGAALPARRAALAPPIQAMNETVNPQKSTRGRGWLGLAIFLLGVLFWFLSLSLVAYDGPEGQGPTPLSWLNSFSPDAALGWGALFIILSVIVMTPSLVVPAQKILGVIPQLLFPVSGKLASRNLDRSKRRTANTAAALFVGLAIVSCVGTLASTLTASTAGLIDEGMTADFAIRSQTMTIPTDLDKKLAKTEGIRSVTKVTMIPRLKFNGKQINGFSMTAKDTLFKDVYKPHMISGSAVSAISKDQLVVGKTIADDNKWSVGTVLTVKSPDATRKIKIGAITDSATYTNSIYLSSKVSDQLRKSYAGVTLALYVSAKPGTNLTSLEKKLKKQVKKYYVLTVMNKEELKSSIATLINNIMVIIYALLALSILIAIFGVVNTMALSVSERTREIGLLRAIGTSNGQVQGMIAIETVMISVLGTVEGIVTGLAAGIVIQQVYKDSGLGTLSIPFKQLLIFLILSVLIGLLASLSPSRRALKVPVLNAVSDE
ncbi:ABC transporter permease [Scardovia inopinata]|uniref:ABC3 transporter permease protein domain-containing protein n=1 Tax=Scardovia inopinata F0304 TaxID=641146 RepID=W5IIF2_SCAIO|nr:ABC transporter permease [Scardovia inopinata]EFG26783.1 hypothetical protein HMPREF9020_00410 [Scardovia inopinata F0304]BAR06386.1 putative ABC transporter permease component [Scardovia inopinata JCM 12537]SUV51903.1 ABC transporter permease [Scardovia inopinata]